MARSLLISIFIPTDKCFLDLKMDFSLEVSHKCRVPRLSTGLKTSTSWVPSWDGYSSSSKAQWAQHERKCEEEGRTDATEPNTSVTLNPQLLRNLHWAHTRLTPSTKVWMGGRGMWGWPLPDNYWLLRFGERKGHCLLVCATEPTKLEWLVLNPLSIHRPLKPNGPLNKTKKELAMGK